MQLPRITTRRLMALVAVVALSFAIGITWKRLAFFRERANFCTVQERAYFQEAGNDYQLAYDSERSGEPQEGIEFANKARWENQMALYFGNLRRKYERAVWRPWNAVPPDPQEPEPEGPTPP